MGAFNYRELDPSLPNVGRSIFSIGRLTPKGAERVAVSTSVPGLAMMNAYVRSYAGPTGGLIFSLGAAGIALTLDIWWWAALSFGSASVMAYVAMEIRRRARMWESLIDARILALTGRRDP